MDTKYNVIFRILLLQYHFLTVSDTTKESLSFKDQTHFKNLILFDLEKEVRGQRSCDILNLHISFPVCLCDANADDDSKKF